MVDKVNMQLNVLMHADTNASSKVQELEEVVIRHPHMARVFLVALVSMLLRVRKESMTKDIARLKEMSGKLANPAEIEKKVRELAMEKLKEAPERVLVSMGEFIRSQSPETFQSFVEDVRTERGIDIEKMMGGGE
jgi:hypothetical protein